MRKHQIHLHLTDKENNILRDDSKKFGLSVSEYIRRLINNAHDSYSTPTVFIPYDESQKLTVRNKYVKVCFTLDEYLIVKGAAKNQSLSSYIADCAIKGQNVLCLTIEDDDYNFLIDIVEPMYYSIYESMFMLKGQSEDLYKMLEKTISRLEETNNNLLFLIDKYKKTRESIRHTRLRELRKQCDYLLSDYDLVTLMEDK